MKSMCSSSVVLFFITYLAFAGRGANLTSANLANPAAAKAGSAAASTIYTTSTLITKSASGGSTYATSILGYPANATGPVSPTFTISSSDIAEQYVGVATDSAGNLFVLSAEFDDTFEPVPGSARILVFAPSTGGLLAAAPTRTITGPAANLDGAGRLAVDAVGNIYLWKTGSDTPPVVSASIVEFAAGANGNVAPIRTIQVAQFPSNDGSGYPEGLAVDANGNIVFAVANSEGLNGTVNTESDQIEVFTPGQSGKATPARTISGPQSLLAQIAGLTLDPVGNIYVEVATVDTAAKPAILEFAGGANPTSSAAPINVITGSGTMLGRFVLDSLAVDAAGNIYVLDYSFPGVETYYLLRFAPGATGSAAPSAAIPSREGVLLALH